MGYTHFYHKGAPRNMSESPDPNVGMSSNVLTDQTQNERSSKILAAGAVVVGVQTVRVANKLIDATGNSTLRRNVESGAKAAGLLLLAVKGGAIGIGLAGLALIGDSAIKRIEEYERQQDDQYKQKLIGERVRKYNKGGAYND